MVTLGLARTLTHARPPGAYRRLAPFSGETRSWARLLKFSSSARHRRHRVEHMFYERHGLTDSLLRKEGRAAGPGHQRPRHLRRRGRGLPCLRLRVYGDRLGRARLRRLRPDGRGRRLPRGQLPCRLPARRRPRGVEERLPQLYDLPDDGWLSRAGGHGGAMGEERLVDVVPLGCISRVCLRTASACNTLASKAARPGAAILPHRCCA